MSLCPKKKYGSKTNLFKRFFQYSGVKPSSAVCHTVGGAVNKSGNRQKKIFPHILYCQPSLCF
jgi:hypothetical protein